MISKESASGISRDLTRILRQQLGVSPQSATRSERLAAVSLMVRERLADLLLRTEEHYTSLNAKRAYYLSAEFLMGRALESNLLHLEIRAETEKALKELYSDDPASLSELLGEEPDAGLGNGGLGRLAACFMESAATLGAPAMGYGIRYEFGIFEQVIEDGFQRERPELWLRYGTPWEFPRPAEAVTVDFGGRSESYTDLAGDQRWRWLPEERIIGIPHDRPIAGFQVSNVNTIRLWQARASEDLDLAAFNRGDYDTAIRAKNRAETISKVLYPNDSTEQGRELRLRQEYFFTRCSIADAIRRHIKAGNPIQELPERAVYQLNDTHPAIAVAELLRILLDEFHLPWDDAWTITRGSIAFTNHTIMSEALERWPVGLLTKTLPRHLELIFEINRRFLDSVREQLPPGPESEARIPRLSIIEEAPEHTDKQVRMANLAIVGSHAVNGVAKLHTEILKKETFRDFHALYPSRFHNITNGVTPVRWLIACNPLLSAAITRRIGSNWMRQLDELSKLEELAQDAPFQKEILEIKRANKKELARHLRETTGIVIDPDSLLDVQIKRIHEYKRQLLNILHVATLSQRLRRSPQAPQLPRTFLIGGKAASAYQTAKRIIKLANSIAERIASEPACRGKLALHFVPNYRVTLAEKLIPAADLSEQISTAGTEASGTSNMKLALNGALTIGTLDGANVEIRSAVRPENFFLFGLDVSAVERTRRDGYDPGALLRGLPKLEEVLHLIDSGHFSPDDPHRFRSLTDDLRHHDPYRIVADFSSYAYAHQEAERLYLQPERWAEMAIRNIAAMGHFSSDRSIREYAENIWKLKFHPLTDQ